MMESVVFALPQCVAGWLPGRVALSSHPLRAVLALIMDFLRTNPWERFI
jgi:hypothetical protein